MPPLPEVWDLLLHAVLPPALVAAALAALAFWAGRWHASLACVGAAIALAAGMALGNWLYGQLLPVTRVPEAAAWEWLPWVALAALAAGVVMGLPRVSAGAGWGLCGMVSAHAGWLLTPAGVREEYGWAPLLMGAVVLADWAVLEQCHARGLLYAAFAAGTASLILILAGSLRFTQVAVILAAALAGIGIAAVGTRSRAAGTAGAAAVILPGLLLAGWYESYSNVPWLSFLLPALSPLALAPSLLSTWQRYQKKGLWAVEAGLVLAPLAIALVLAMQNESLGGYE